MDRNKIDASPTGQGAENISLSSLEELRECIDRFDAQMREVRDALEALHDAIDNAQVPLVRADVAASQRLRADKCAEDRAALLVALEPFVRFPRATEGKGAFVSEKQREVAHTTFFSIKGRCRKGFRYNG